MQPAECSRKWWGAAVATQHPQTPWDTSKLGFVKRRNCISAAPASIFPSPSALGKGGDEEVLEGDVLIQEVKAFPGSPTPAWSDGFIHGTCGNMGHNGHERICKPQPQLWASWAKVKRETIWFLKINMQFYHLCFFLWISCKSSGLIELHRADTILGTTVLCCVLP